MTTPKLYMLIGLPYSGKSTWLRKQIASRINPGFTVLDTDSHIEGIAKEQGLSYGDIFNSTIKYSEKLMYSKLAQAIANNFDIYWDQTNLTARSRAKKLAKIPDNYEKIAVVFGEPNPVELIHRIGKRNDKVIPKNVVDNMRYTYENPTQSEGFTKILHIGG
jgi:predicted kinase